MTSMRTLSIDELKEIGRTGSLASECDRLSRTLKLINGRTDPNSDENVGSFIIIETPKGFIQFLDNVTEGDSHSYIMEVSPVNTNTGSPSEISGEFRLTLEKAGFVPLNKYGIWRREFDALASRNYDGLAELTAGFLVSFYGLAPTEPLDIQFWVQNVVNRLIPVEEVRYLTNLNYKDFREFFVYIIEENFDFWAYTKTSQELDRFRLKRLVDFMDAFLTVALELIDKLRSEEEIPFDLIDEIESLHTIMNQRFIDLKSEFKAELYN